VGDIRGIVQRSAAFVFSLADRYGLAGFVRNQTGGLVNQEHHSAGAFRERLIADAPGSASNTSTAAP
jgi:hydrogenase maturation factor HypF (carbamoyltransferase family)